MSAKKNETCKIASAYTGPFLLAHLRSFHRSLYTMWRKVCRCVVEDSHPEIPRVAFAGRSVGVKVINELRDLMVSPMGLFFGGGHEEGGVGAESADGEGVCVLPSLS